MRTGRDREIDIATSTDSSSINTISCLIGKSDGVFLVMKKRREVLLCFSLKTYNRRSALSTRRPIVAIASIIYNGKTIRTIIEQIPNSLIAWAT